MNGYDSPVVVPVWSEDRACRDAPLDIFFPPTGGSGVEAKTFCRRCPIIDVCLEWAMAQPPESLKGVWGGTTAYQRKRKMVADQAKHGVSAGQRVA